MSDIEDFDQSHRTHFRSDEELARIHARLPWNQTGLKWGAIALVFAATAALTQVAVWAWQDQSARETALQSIPRDKIWSGCNEVRAAGVAPLGRNDPGYESWMDGDNDGLACEPQRGILSRIFVDGDGDGDYGGRRRR